MEDRKIENREIVLLHKNALLKLYSLFSIRHYLCFLNHQGLFIISNRLI